MPQVLKMASVVAKLQTSLDVYEGMYARKEDAELTIRPFREIGNSLRAALSTHIIIGCAAIFSDPERSCGNENMSLQNLVSKHKSRLSQEALDLLKEITTLVDDMNLKKFRNKHVGHFDLEACLGYSDVKRNINVQNVRDLLRNALRFINLVIRDANLMEQGHSLAYYSKIPSSRSTGVFLSRLKSNA